MKKTLIITLTLLIACSAFGEGRNEKTPIFGVNLGYNFGLKKGMGGCFYAQPELGTLLTEHFYLGAGTGVVTNEQIKGLSIPAFLRTEIVFPQQEVTPYVSLQGGYDFNVRGGVGSGRFSPSVGLRVPISRCWLFNLGVGYTRTISEYGGADFLGFNAGLSFNPSKKNLAQSRSKVADFFRGLDYDVELETMTPTKVIDGKNTNKYSGMLCLRLSAMDESPIEDFNMGVSIGLGRCNYVYIWQGESISYVEQDYNEIFFAAMFRARYKVEELTFREKFHPFAQLEVGLGGWFDFQISPAVGVSIESDKFRDIDISAGYYRFGGKGSLRIAVGFPF